MGSLSEKRHTRLRRRFGVLGQRNVRLFFVGYVASNFGTAMSSVTVALFAGRPPIWVFACVDAASYAVSAVALSLLHLPPSATVAVRSLFRDLAEGWDQFRSRTWLRVLTAQFALFNLITWGPLPVLGPVITHDNLGEASAWGAIMAAYGAGAVVGGLTALGRKPRRPLMVARPTSHAQAAYSLRIQCRSDLRGADRLLGAPLIPGQELQIHQPGVHPPPRRVIWTRRTLPPVSN